MAHASAIPGTLMLRRRTDHETSLHSIVKIRCPESIVHNDCLPAANGCATPGTHFGSYTEALSTDNIVQTDGQLVAYKTK